MWVNHTSTSVHPRPSENRQGLLSTRACSPRFRSPDGSSKKKGCARCSCHGSVHTWVCMSALSWRLIPWALIVPFQTPLLKRQPWKWGRSCYLGRAHGESLMHDRPSFVSVLPFRGPLRGSPRKSERGFLRGIADHSQSTGKLGHSFFLPHGKRGNSPVRAVCVRFQAPREARQSQLEDMRHWGSAPHPDGDKPSWSLIIRLSCQMSCSAWATFQQPYCKNAQTFPHYKCYTAERQALRWWSNHTRGWEGHVENIIHHIYELARLFLFFHSPPAPQSFRVKTEKICFGV